jgi:hypothetical protein
LRARRVRADDRKLDESHHNVGKLIRDG